MGQKMFSETIVITKNQISSKPDDLLGFKLLNAFSAAVANFWKSFVVCAVVGANSDKLNSKKLLNPFAILFWSKSQCRQ